MNDTDRKQVADQFRARGFRVTLTGPVDTARRADSARPPVSRDPQRHDQDYPTARDRANAHLRRMGLPEIQQTPEPATKQERAAARVRRMGLTPVSDQQPTNRTE